MVHYLPKKIIADKMFEFVMKKDACDFHPLSLVMLAR